MNLLIAVGVFIACGVTACVLIGVCHGLLDAWYNR